MFLTLRHILVEFRGGLEQLYGPRLVEVVLFGSQARDDGSPDSDVDVMIVLRGGVDPNQEMARVSPLASELSLKHDVVISCIYISEESFRNEDCGVDRSGALLSHRSAPRPVATRLQSGRARSHEVDCTSNVDRAAVKRRVGLDGCITHIEVQVA